MNLAYQDVQEQKKENMILTSTPYSTPESAATPSRPSTERESGGVNISVPEEEPLTREAAWPSG